MATAGEVEYESDPEEVTLSLAMRRRRRRREASDEEEEGNEDERDNRESNLPMSINSRARIAPDMDSDCEGAPADYDDYPEIDEDIEDEREEVAELKYVEGRRNVGVAEVAGGEKAMCKELKDNTGRSVDESEDVKEDEKKKNDPVAVPTAGAFYMHDDRFRDNAGGRHRRTHGGRELWESKVDWKWGHDKFEEMTLQERHYRDVQDRRNTRGHYQARGRNQGSDPRYTRRNMYKASNNIDENHGLKSVRGRGPKRYQPSANNQIEVPLIQDQQFVKSTKKDSQNLGRFPTVTTNEEFDAASNRKQVFASSLNFASPPFYPSSSSNKDIPLTQKRDLKAGAIGHNLQPAAPRQKNLAASVAMEKLYVNDSLSQVSGKSSSRKTVSYQSPLVHNSSQLRAQVRALAPQVRMTFPAVIPLHQQVQKSSPPTQVHAVKQNAVQARVRPPSPASAYQFGEGSGGGTQISSLQKTSASVHLPVFEEAEISSELSNLKFSLDGKRRGSLQVSGKGPFLYGGAQFIGSSGNMGVHCDKNFSAAPAFLPVMPFGSQHPGMGVPAVGMAFPGYVAQPQHGMGNSEMTWLPVLAGAAADALGATYCPPYIGNDGAYHSLQTAQTSPLVTPSEESSANNKSIDERKPSQKKEIANEEFVQRQKNTRRYTSMNFGQ